MNEPADCTLNVTKSIGRGDNPEFGGTYSRITYEGSIFCYGVVDLYDVDWPRAQDVEVLFEFTAEQQFGVWAGCGPDWGDIRFLRCVGAGTPVLDVLLGYHFSSGIKRPWRYVALGDSYLSGLGAGDY